MDRFVLCLVRIFEFLEGFFPSPNQFRTFEVQHLRLNFLLNFILKAIRTQEGNEAQVCLCIIQLILLKSPEFLSRVKEFVTNSPDHWKQSNWFVYIFFITSKCQAQLLQKNLSLLTIF